MLIRSLLIASMAATPLLAQAPASSPVSDVRALWSQTRDFIVAAAKDVPESMYSYKPTPDVRTFGELLAHIAGSQSMFCAMARGEKPPAEDAVEKGPLTKAALIAALDASNKDCAKSYQQTKKTLTGMVDVFGTQRSRFYALAQNATHINEHYGNIVTYMRLNKMVPPSSKPRPGGH